jgi:hypothetical protein
MPLRSDPFRRLSARLRDHASFEELRARREHDEAMASDHRIALEHRAQVDRSVGLGQGGCRFCD